MPVYPGLARYGSCMERFGEGLQLRSIKLWKRGVPVEETTPIPGADRFFIRDPDQNRIEIIQWHRPYDPEADGFKG